ncbi:DUF2236 domain-containing protein [Fulvivirga sp. 29W222]|uniref:DUF2236 domain-containing protein n=1 Tax=Fulvivirga marina TaxID=2494733 RepID=A0A937FWG1_9BACT|nr:oxygenase MpaB family protein [Fulvivirga marina]MBL6445635.1 DUF2236 domain-containing protein [Fulvivirga marina]
MSNSIKWSDDFLESKRSETDPIADQVVATIIESGYEEKINEVFTHLVRNSSFNAKTFSSLPKKVSEVVTSYFEETKNLPSWADASLMRTGEEVFTLYGPEIAMILNVKSLPLCYACSKGAKVLYMTGRLTERSGSIDPLARRLMETAQMIMNALSPGGMSPQGNGIVTIQKVRLIHASIRYFLLHEKYNPKGWDTDYYGKPINQEDLAGTLMSFGPLVIQGLKQLGINLSNKQVSGFMHSWKVIGYLMGVDDEFLPDTFEEGWDLGIAIMKHQAAESDEGKELTKACINFLKHILPGTAFDEVPEYMIWYFVQDISKAIDKDLAQFLGVRGEHDIRSRIVFKLCRLFIIESNRLEEHSDVIALISGMINKKLLQGFLLYYNDHKNVRFYIPPSLQKDWKLHEKWEDMVVITPNIFGKRLVIQKKTDTLI